MKGFMSYARAAGCFIVSVIMIVWCVIDFVNGHIASSYRTHEAFGDTARIASLLGIFAGLVIACMGVYFLFCGIKGIDDGIDKKNTDWD